MTAAHPLWQWLNYERWAREVLVQLLVKPGADVLELRPAASTAVNSWIKVPVGSYTGIESSMKDMDIAEEKWQKSTISHEIVYYDLDTTKLETACADRKIKSYDSVACFRGLCNHFVDEGQAKLFLRDISRQLKLGGYFFGFVPDSSVIWTRANRVDSDGWIIKGSLYSITFDDNSYIPFGTSYTLSLAGFPSTFVEYLVHFPSFIQLAAENGMEFVNIMNWSEFFEDHKSTFASTLKAKQVLDPKKKTLDPLMLDVISLYAVFVFRKVLNT